MTRILSAAFIVERRWAITKLVRPLMRRSIASWMRLSVRVSTELVASSSISSGASFTSALAMLICCLCPADSEDGSLMNVSSPSGRDLRYPAIPTASQASSIAESPIPSFPRVMFSRMVPRSIQASCRTTLKSLLTSSRLISVMSAPSIEILPESAS